MHDMQVAGAYCTQCDPYDGVSRVLQAGHRAVTQFDFTSLMADKRFHDLIQTKHFLSLLQTVLSSVFIIFANAANAAVYTSAFKKRPTEGSPKPHARFRFQTQTVLFHSSVG